MKKLRIYVDTSVIGGQFDHEFAEWSTALADDFRRGRFLPVVSDVTSAEIADAPRFVQKAFSELVNLGAEMVEVSAEALALLDGYAPHAVYWVPGSVTTCFTSHWQLLPRWMYW